MAVRYIVELTDEERHQLKEIISKNKANRNAIVNAYVLLRSDVACGWTYQEIATAYDVSMPKVERVRKRFVEEGLETFSRSTKSTVSLTGTTSTNWTK